MILFDRTTCSGGLGGGASEDRSGGEGFQGQLAIAVEVTGDLSMVSQMLATRTHFRYLSRVLRGFWGACCVPAQSSGTAGVEVSLQLCCTVL